MVNEVASIDAETESLPVYTDVWLLANNEYHGTGIRPREPSYGHFFMLPVHQLNRLSRTNSSVPPPFDPIDRGRLVCWLTYALAFWGPVFAALYGCVLGSFDSSVALCIATAFALLTPSVFARSGSVTVAGNYLTSVLFVILLFLTSINGGHGAPSIIWNIAIPIFVMLLANPRSAVFWTILVIGQYVFFFLLNRWGYVVPQQLTAEAMRILELAGLTGLTMLLLSVAGLFEHYRRLMKNALEGANRAKSDFLANMSHELRTPMTAILGFAEYLGEPELSPAQREEAIKTINRNGDHLLKIVNDILDITKVETNCLEIEYRRFCVAELIWGIQDLMQVRSDAKSIQFEVKFASSIPESIDSDPLRLRQILINLIGNAIRFTEKGSVRVIVHYLEDRFCPLLRFDVIDTGIGIGGDQVDRLFQPFAQADGSPTRKFAGAGLGLAISKRLTEMLGGTISVHSELGQGSQFGVTLPLSAAGVPLIEPVRPDGATIKPTNHAEGSPKKPLSGRQVLIADDSSDSLRLMSHILEKAGARVATAENGQRAVDIVTAADSAGESFDAILMDVQMPVLDGHAATGQLRESGFHRPIIAVTARAMNQDRIDCIAAGCDDVVTKPVDRRKLVDAIVAAISGHSVEADSVSGCRSHSRR